MRGKKRKQVKKACVNCQKSHACCEEKRPCKRCVTLGIADKCVDASRKKRGRKKKEINVSGFSPDSPNSCNTPNSLNSPNSPNSYESSSMSNITTATASTNSHLKTKTGRTDRDSCSSVLVIGTGSSLSSRLSYTPSFAIYDSKHHENAPAMDDSRQTNVKNSRDMEHDSCTMKSQKMNRKKRKSREDDVFEGKEVQLKQHQFYESQANTNQIDSQELQVTSHKKRKKEIITKVMDNCNQNDTSFVVKPNFLNVSKTRKRVITTDNDVKFNGKDVHRDVFQFHPDGLVSNDASEGLNTHQNHKEEVDDDNDDDIDSDNDDDIGSDNDDDNNNDNDEEYEDDDKEDEEKTSDDDMKYESENQKIENDDDGDLFYQDLSVRRSMPKDSFHKDFSAPNTKVSNNNESLESRPQISSLSNDHHHHLSIPLIEDYQKMEPMSSVSHQTSSQSHKTDQIDYSSLHGTNHFHKEQKKHQIKSNGIDEDVSLEKGKQKHHNNLTEENLNADSIELTNNFVEELYGDFDSEIQSSIPDITMMHHFCYPSHHINIQQNQSKDCPQSYQHSPSVITSSFPLSSKSITFPNSQKLPQQQQQQPEQEHSQQKESQFKEQQNHDEQPIQYSSSQNTMIQSNQVQSDDISNYQQHNPTLSSITDVRNNREVNGSDTCFKTNYPYIRKQFQFFNDVLKEKMEEIEQLKREKQILSRNLHNFMHNQAKISQHVFDSVAFSFAYEHMTLPMAMIASSSGEFLSVNKSFCNFFGLDQGNFKKFKWDNIAQSNDQQILTRQALRSNIKCKHLQSGETLNVSMHFDPITDNNNNPMFTIGIVLNQTSEIKLLDDSRHLENQTNYHEIQSE